MRIWQRIAAIVCLAGAVGAAQAQRQALDSTQPATSRRTRLFLKDGSYQVVMSYTVVGARVKFTSAERAGETEEIPLELVDLAKTKKWAADHAAADSPDAQKPGLTIDPELLKEEAERAALTPEVAPDLRLAAEKGVLALDTFQGGPELVALSQNDTDLNRQTAHGILKSVINPRSATHQIVQLKGEKADVQLHVNEPVLYLRLDDEQATSGEALTVDTHGANATETAKRKAATPSEYVIVRLDVRQDARIVSSFDLNALGTDKKMDDVTETVATPLPGGHWVKVVPREPLLIGEYALVEVLGAREINLGVWDFGVHPTAPENREAMRPEKRRPVVLERRH